MIDFLSSKLLFLDEREWDAFISYNEKDREYVLKYLYPKLEKELGFKLCLQ
jgi:hypothetical protein